MCGFTGFLDFRKRLGPDELRSTARDMALRIRHRGPDDSGEWVDAEAGIAFGFRRLSIIDTSAAGHQPMLSPSGRYVLMFNGEFYNFAEVRKELPSGISFRGHSDTEVILAGIETWGLEATVSKMIGMFAFALWDRELQLLHLVRDRIGVKPLYYGKIGSTFFFGSELKAFTAHPAFAAEIDRTAVALLLRYGYIPTPHTIYSGISKLTPGAILSVASGKEPIETRYWSGADVALAGLRSPFTGTAAEAEQELDGLLRSAVGYRMVSDVPIGVFLSGGIDSSTVVAFMQAQSAQPVKSFSIGFHEQTYDEAKYAKAVARHLGTDHTELYVTPEEALAVIPKLPAIYDEPFADPSQIPTYLVSALARRRVTVSLSGDGGDELFGGYNRYFLGRSVWDAIGWIPTAIRAAGGRTIGAIRPGTWDRIFGVLPQRVRPSAPGDKIGKAAEVIGLASPDDIYRRLVSQWPASEQIVRGVGAGDSAHWDDERVQSVEDFTHRMMLLDLLTYLPDDIMVKVDRASMAVSLEAREPLLDHRLVAFAWRLPLHMKVRNGKGKWLLRRVLSRYVPADLMERPKMGFGLPIDQWLRGPLRDWADDLLDESRLRSEGILDPEPIRRKWLEHRNGTRNWHYRLWTVLMFQLWLREHAGAAVEAPVRTALPT